MIGFHESRRMGEHSTSGVTSNFRNTIKAMKRLVGLPFDCPRAKHEMSFCDGVKFAPLKHDHGPDSIGVNVSLNGEDQTVSIEAVLGMMVKHMGEIVAEKSAGGQDDIAMHFPQDWVIAIPNYYTDAQRRAVLSGCEIVGITGVQRLMHENTATALAYGIFKDARQEFKADSPTNVMFIDMGASAYTVSIVSFVPGKLIVKSAFCDPDLGGRDFDLVIATWIANEFEAKHKNKLSGKPLERPKTRLKLLMNAEKAKKTLSPQGVKEARLNLEMLMDDLDFSISLQADTYETMCQPLLSKLEAPIQNCLKEAELTVSDLAAVEIVGGSTRIGCLKRKLQDILGGATLSTTMNADEAVARGAALQSAILSPRFKVRPYEIHEAQPYPIQISWQDDDKASGVEVDASTGEESPTDSVVMFDRGLNFPIVRRVTLRRAGEFTVKAHYDTEAVQRFGIPPPVDIADFTIKVLGDAEQKVRVNVKQDVHGIVQLSSAQMVEEIEEEDDAPMDGDADKKEGGDGDGDGAAKEGDEAKEQKKKKIKKTNLEFSTLRPLEWTKTEINKAYEAEVRMANSDRVVKETSQMRNDLESYIYSMRDKVVSDSMLGQYGTNEEKEAFTSANDAMENWLYEDGFDANKSVYAEKLAELKKLGAPFETRQAEAEARSGALKQLQSNLENFQKWVNDSQTQERYDHITDEEREVVREMTDNTTSWMYEMLDKQGGLSANQDPVLKVADLKAKNEALNKKCLPIMTRAKPPPPKMEEPKKEEPTPDASPAGDNVSGEPMEGVEKESNGDNQEKMDVDA